MSCVSNLKYTIIFEDADIIAVNKESGISVGGDRWDACKERLDTIIQKDAGLETIFKIHRLDNASSGLVIFAKNAASHKKLSTAFEKRDVKKTYIAIVHGRPVWEETICDLPLVQDGNKKHLSIVDKHRGKKSLTRFKLVANAGNYSIISAFPETGRQHQIRVHLAKIGHPIVCDELYGKSEPVFLSKFKRKWKGDPFEEKALISRLALHSESLLLPDYFLSGEKISKDSGGEQQGNALFLSAPLHKDMKALISQIKKCAK
jgi:23S rRNA pseudouridine1911/1915/1917 synthase